MAITSADKYVVNIDKKPIDEHHRLTLIIDWYAVYSYLTKDCKVKSIEHLFQKIDEVIF